MDRPARPDDGSPARLIATMVGIVGILLLGSLFWSAVGSLFSALGDATAAMPLGRPPATRVISVVVVTPASTPPPQPTARPTPTLVPTAVVDPTPAPTVAPTPAASGRAPWILLPQPAPGSHVVPGPVVVEARGRGEAPIADIRLELDGVPLAVSLEQRSEATWRGSANTQITPGRHAVRATVIDSTGRSGGFHWTFDAAP